jgi:hypothetical protein
MRGLAIALTCIASLGLFFFSPAGTKLRARLHWSIDDARGGARLLLWRDSMEMGMHRPIVGFGPETFASEFPRFESVQLASAYPDFYHESAHNIFLDALTSQGVLGLLALAGLIALGSWAALHACRRGDPLDRALGAAFVALLVAQQFTAFIFTTSLYAHLLIAMLVVTAWTSPALSKSSTRAAWAVVPLSLIALVFVGYAAQLLFADHALALTWRRLASADIAGAKDAYAMVLRWQPAGTTSDLSYSRQMQQAAQRTPVFTTRLLARQQALDAGIRAVRNAEDRQNAWYNLAMLLAEQKDAAGTERSLRNAIAWAPNWFKPHWSLARLLMLTGHADDAVREARLALECDGSHDPEVTETWKQLQAHTPALQLAAP